MRLGILILSGCVALSARGVRVEFDPGNPEIGPFPSDALMFPDPRQRSGLRVALPLGDCQTRPSECLELAQINELDGFSPTPRMSIRFSGAIDPESLRDNVFVAWLDQLIPGRYRVHEPGKLSPVNYLIWDPASRTAYLKPDEMLEGTRLYALIVTDGVRDADGDPVEASPEYTACTSGPDSDYCRKLSAALGRVRVGSRTIVGASVFTTLSVTAFLEEARRIVQETPTGFRRTNPALSVANVTSVTYRQHVSGQGETAAFADQAFPIPPGLIQQAGVGSLAFGSFRSPQFIDPATLRIPQTPTAGPVAAPPAAEEIFFHVWMPVTPAPPGGYPVLLAGHGITDSRFGMPTAMALGAGAGFAVVAMTAVGHGAGPQSSVVLAMASGSAVTIAAPGRGRDTNRDGRIESAEGFINLVPDVFPIAGDAQRQTVVDYMQLIHAIREGMDFDGDGRADLNGNAISYIGQSLGGGYGVVLAAVEPAVRSAVFNVAPGGLLETSLTTDRADFHLFAQAGLGVLRRPAVVDPRQRVETGIPFRDEPVRVRRPGLVAVQDTVERLDWLGGPREAQNYAPHLRTATLPGLDVRPMLFQFGYGDVAVPNNSTANLIRAANMREFTSLYRADIARQVAPEIPRDQHAYLIPLGPPASQLISLAAITEALQFLGTGQMADVNPLVRLLIGRDLFEAPPAQLPVTPNFPPPAR
ncbi:MAG: hypothetical protein FJW39_12505 [Acidobacteria bacterium]|nr:hypothetical protein [Acidobacteriota bacterium]